MSRVLLLIPGNRFDQYYIQVPLDAVYAAGQIRADGHRVTVWDQRLDDAPETTEHDVAFVFTAIADRAQCYPLDLGPIRDAVDRARSHCRLGRVVAVGPHGTHLPTATLADLGVEHVARGEADSAAIGAMRDLLKGETRPVLPGGTGAAGVLTLTDAAATPSYPNLSLETLAPAAFDLFPLSRYTSGVVRDGLPERGPCGMVFAARGCTYGCTFCHLPFGVRVRTTPVERVLSEVAAQQSAGLTSTFFLDYVFGLNRRFYQEICAGMRGQGIEWFGQTRAEVVMSSDVSSWYEAGCRGMWIGAESPTVAGAGVHKRVSAETVESAVTKLSDAGIVPYAFVLMGLPNDAASLSGALVDWAAQLPAWFGLNQLFLRPGTALYDEVVAQQDSAPTTWAQVEQLTARYRAEYPADLDAQEERLRGLPNFLGNAIAAVA